MLMPLINISRKFSFAVSIKQLFEIIESTSFQQLHLTRKTFSTILANKILSGMNI